MTIYRLYVWSRRNRDWTLTDASASSVAALIPAAHEWMALGYPRYSIRKVG